MKDKPPYVVPSMEAIATLPWNGLTVASLFSGCGGSSLGYKMAGYRVLWANEFIPAAQAVYRLNHPDTLLDLRDIRQIAPSDILQALHLCLGDLDLLDGSPPCASFSTAGKRERHWGKVKSYSDTKQRTDDLFWEYARLLQGLQPKVFVAENVSGLVKGVAKGYFKEILALLKGCGYRVEARLLDAQWLGVPQMRQRIIFQGVRQDFGLAPAFPTPLPYRYSVREALPWIVTQGDNAGFGGGCLQEATGPSPTIGGGPQSGNGRFPPSLVEARVIHATGGQYSTGDIPDKPMPTMQAVLSRAYRDKRGAFGHEGDSTDQLASTVLSDSVGTHWIETEADSDITRYAIGREWDKLQPGQSTFYGGRLWKPDPKVPSPMITQMGGNPSVASVTHPTEKRKFTIAELKRICAFPDDFILTGSYAQQWERLGRAVPPVMMKYVAEAIRDNIFHKL